MTQPSPASAAADFDDPRVAEALERYLAALESGRPVDRAAFVRAHSDIADVLDECLSGLEFLQQAAPHEISDRPPERLDEYRILREIGRGGMGVVYEAERTTDGRRVAVKTLPAAAGWQPVDRERFRNEATAVGLLDHPNIVPVLAVGCDRGTHYFVMPLIVGASLAELIDPACGPTASTVPDTPGQRGGTSESIPVPTPASHAPRSPKEVARLLVQAAEALAHAHDRGIVHRDVKPANCLVDAHGRLWVVDFGLARLSGADRLTRTGAMVGTLQYMAPEQVDAARGIVDQRTDLYGLGATLYEALTRRPLFATQDRGQLIAAILNDDPPPPRRISPGIPFDLETITLKLLAKAPADRYPSAAAAVDDMRAFLDDKPIAARRPSWVQRGEKWLARHRGVALTVVSAAALVIALQAWNTVRLLDREAGWKMEAQTVRVMLDEMVMTFTERVLPRVGGLEDDHREFLTKARDQYARLAGLKWAGADDRLAAARSRRRVGDLDVLLGDVTRAEESYRDVLDQLAALPDGSPDRRREAAITANNLGNLYRQTGRIEDAGKQYATAAATFGEFADQYELAGAELNQGLVWQLLGQHAKAVEAFQTAQTRFARLATEHRDRTDFREHAAFAGHNLAVSLHALNRDADASKALRESLTIWDGALADPKRPLESRRRAARTRLELARVLIAMNQSAEAQTQAERARQLFENLAGSSPRVGRYKLDEAVARRVVAEALFAQGQRPLAEPEVDRVLARLLLLAEAHEPDAAAELVATYCFHAQVHATGKRRGASEMAMQAAAKWAERLPLGPTTDEAKALMHRVQTRVREQLARE